MAERFLCLERQCVRCRLLWPGSQHSCLPGSATGPLHSLELIISTLSLSLTSPSEPMKAPWNSKLCFCDICYWSCFTCSLCGLQESPGNDLAPHPVQTLIWGMSSIKTSCALRHEGICAEDYFLNYWKEVCHLLLESSMTYKYTSTLKHERTLLLRAYDEDLKFHEAVWNAKLKGEI